MIEKTRIKPEDLESLRTVLPGPDPILKSFPGSMGTHGPAGIIPVSDTLLDGNELLYLSRCVQSNWISSAGPFVKEFEERFANAMGCAFGVACASGTAALHLALATLGIGPGDEVIIPTFTMIATANAVSYTGATPVLVDAEATTWNLDVSQVQSRITSRTKAIVVVHTYGHPVDMDPLLEMAEKHGLYVVEDAAEAHGALYRGRPVGSLGHLATFSFYANKIITTGEGGMVTTNNKQLAELARRLRDHAFSAERHFWHEYRGFNYRMTNLQAAIGLAQTERLADLVARRRANAGRYRELLSPLAGLTLPPEVGDVKNVFWMFSILVEKEFGCSRDELRGYLASQGIETRTFFIPIHCQPIYFEQYRGQHYRNAEALCRQGLYLPSGPTLTEANLQVIAQAVAQAPRQSLGKCAA